jgi:hypothetical protein
MRAFINNYFLGEKMQLRKVAVGLLVIASLSTLTACGAGENAASRNIKKVTDGAETTVTTATSDLKLRGFLVVAQPDGSGVLVGTIVNANETSDSLLGVAINNSLATVTAATREISQSTPMIFEGDSANAKAVVLAAGIKAGSSVEISFFFKDAGVITVSAIARDKRDTYAGVTV